MHDGRFSRLPETPFPPKVAARHLNLGRAKWGLFGQEPTPWKRATKLRHAPTRSCWWYQRLHVQIVSPSGSVSWDEPGVSNERH